MPATTAGAHLTEAHRRAQAELGAQVVALTAALWPLLDPDRIEATLDRWLTAIVAIATAQHDASARLGAAYLDVFRGLEAPDAAAFTPALPVLDAPALTTSLVVTGPVAYRAALARNVPRALALERAQTGTTGAAMRHALNGGRDVITEAARTDPAARGWARATSGRACHFCALLAARGPVFRAETATFHAHDHCSCTAEPVYRANAQWPTGSRHYQELYQQAKVDARDAGIDPATAFRRLIEAR